MGENNFGRESKRRGLCNPLTAGAGGFGEDFVFQDVFDVFGAAVGSGPGALSSQCRPLAGGALDRSPEWGLVPFVPGAYPAVDG